MILYIPHLVNLLFKNLKMKQGGNLESKNDLSCDICSLKTAY